MLLFKNIRKWGRKDFDPPLSTEKESFRKLAELEADHDLQKPIQQFLCDVHEEAHRPPCEKSNNEHLTYADDRILDAIDKISCQNKRIVALQTKTAYEATKTTNWMILMTIVIAFLTFILTIDTLIKYFSYEDRRIHLRFPKNSTGKDTKSNVCTTYCHTTHSNN